MQRAKGARAAASLVLVVEDLEETYEMLTDMLADAGFRVVGAGNGIDAVDTAVRLLPDVIIMDLSLPLMGGCEAARLLKSDERTSDIPILALTGHHNYVQLAHEAGCDAFLTKPCEPARLLAEIRKALRLDRQDPTVRIRLGLALKARIN
jgi:two-component system, cell cycle response regulator DivK